MKNILHILSILILFQSCYSYKTFDIKEYEKVNPTKVKIELKNSTKLKGKPIGYKNEILTVKKINETLAIPISDIITIKQRNFSWLKTTGLTLVTFGIVIVVSFIIALSDLGITPSFRNIK
ncbi:hypothetical protein [Polaribacter sp.]|uniref:hypothetical protein n=1 Tax=Polaribacter sp. TaxID=1920175 RepID=UPI003F6D9FF9